MKVKIALELEVAIDETNFKDEESDQQMTTTEILDQIQEDITQDLEEFVSNYGPTVLSIPTVTEHS